MNRTLLLLFGTTLVLLLPALARADGVDDYLKAEMARSHIPGVAVAVVRDGRVVKLRAYGRANLEWDAPATAHTAFQLASATKPLTGTALMLLVQEGKIGLDDPISGYLPDCPPAWAGVTVRQLANHTSGIPDDLGSAPARTADETLAAAMKLPLTHAPGPPTASPATSCSSGSWSASRDGRSTRCCASASSRRWG